MKYTVIIIIFWIFTGVIAGGASNAYFRNTYPNLYEIEKKAQEKCGLNFVLGIGGPLSLILVTFTSSFLCMG